MRPIYKKEFHEVFQEHQEHSEFGPLLERMHVVDANGESQMDEDQWEAASEYPLLTHTRPLSSQLGPDIYVAFAFEKR